MLKLGFVAQGLTMALAGAWSENWDAAGPVMDMPPTFRFPIPALRMLMGKTAGAPRLMLPKSWDVVESAMAGTGFGYANWAQPISVPLSAWQHVPFMRALGSATWSKPRPWPSSWASARRYVSRLESPNPPQTLLLTMTY